MRDNYASESTPASNAFKGKGWDDDDDDHPIDFDLCTPQGMLNHGKLHSEAMMVGQIHDRTIG